MDPFDLLSYPPPGIQYHGGAIATRNIHTGALNFHYPPPEAKGIIVFTPFGPKKIPFVSSVTEEKRKVAQQHYQIFNSVGRKTEDRITNTPLLNFRHLLPPGGKIVVYEFDAEGRSMGTRSIE